MAKLDLELFIEGEKVNLFKDETVSITQTLKDVKDIAKIFTEFTKTFTLPADRINNKIFKHYYNFNVVGGFDARQKVNANLELNSQPFKNGKLQLNGVDLRNRKPYAYKVTFFGSAVELKDILGEDKLSALPKLNDNVLFYGPGNVLGKLTNNFTDASDVITPLITHSQRLFFDSNPSDTEAQTGNCHYDQNVIRGVRWNQLKYAIRVNTIIEAIEDKYKVLNGYPVNLKFSNDFFNNTSITKMHNLFMWMHRKSGHVENLNNTTENTTIVDGFGTFNQTPYDMGFLATDTLFAIPPFPLGPFGSFNEDFQIDEVRIRMKPNSNETDSYRYGLFKDFDETPIFLSGVVTGDQTTTWVRSGGSSSLNPSNFDDTWQLGSNYQIKVISSSVINFTGAGGQITVTFEGDTESEDEEFGIDDQFIASVSTTNFATSSVFQFIPTQQIPELKIIDLLTGLFKMFNLVAYVDPASQSTGVIDQNDAIITVKPFDDYYASYNTYEIDEYTDLTKEAVDVALPYKKVLFKYKDTKTFLAERYRQLANKTWGEVNYTEPSLKEIEGRLYKVEVPFGHMQFERLDDAFDTSADPRTKIMYGYNVNESQNAYQGAALLFYPIRVDSGLATADRLSVVNVVDIDNPDIGTNHQSLRHYITASNHYALEQSTTDPVTTIHFGSEISEWTRASTFPNSLFVEEYETYITDIFNRRRRLIKIKAYLPLKIYLKLTLSDRKVYKGEEYNINKVTTNLQTGESKMELINIIVRNT